MNQPVATTIRLAAELVGTAFLLIAIVGSGAMAETLTGDVGLQLLQNSVATAATLGALIVTLGPISGAHLNPAVTLTARLLGHIGTRAAIGYAAAQVVGAAVGVVAANLMFDLTAVDWSATGRGGGGLVLAEGIATFGLIAVVFLGSRFHPPPVVAASVAAYIVGAFAFTSSTSFANPAVTTARTLTDTFAGIDPSSVPAFLCAQLLGTVAAVALMRPVLEHEAAPVDSALPG